MLSFALSGWAQEFTFDTDTEGWSGSVGAAVVHEETAGTNGILKVTRQGATSQGNNARISYDTGTIDATANNYFKIVVKNESNAAQLRLEASSGTYTANEIQIAISTGDTEFKTYFISLSSFASWDSNAEAVRLVFRNGYAEGVSEGSIYINSIEFFTFNEQQTFGELLENPDFEDQLGALPGWNTNNINNSTYSNTTIEYDDTQSGQQALRINYTGDQTAQNILYHNYIKDLGSMANHNNSYQITFWVKSNKAMHFEISTFIRLQDAAGNAVKNYNITQLYNEPTNDWQLLTFVTSDEDFVYQQLKVEFRIPYDSNDPFNDGTYILFDNFEACVNCSLSVNKINKEDRSLSLYPNPVKDQLNLDFSGKTIVKVEIYSVLGQKVFEQEKNANLNVAQLKTGVYIAKVFASDNEISTRQFIKQ